MPSYDNRKEKDKMAILKCKMCGGNLEVVEKDKIVTCPYCGSQQTVPTTDDEKKVKLYNRANSCRLHNEFDMALSVYQSIVSEFPDEAEAYWGICLCKYGLEYIDDPKTGDKIPTCHRTCYESILNDSNYKKVLELSDVSSREIYEKEAKEIDRLQKEILSISQKEEPYDIFICYKETDDKGERTLDSVIAQDIYSSLTEKGYKVFFSRITLESKIGFQYEPIIFAALRSAKVMLAIGTKPEYFDSVWIKNEWSRYISFMKGTKDKYFIPCYRNMDAYDMPKEFQGFQSQNMEKIGFLQDLERGIDKIFGKGEIKDGVLGSKEKDETDELSKLYLVARRAKDNNDDNAIKYYDMILAKDPTSWEAAFYVVWFTAWNCKIRDIQSACISVSNCVKSAINLVKDNVIDRAKQIEAIKEIANRCTTISTALYDSALNYYKNIGLSIQNLYIQETVSRCFSAFNILYTVGDTVDALFGDYLELHAVAASAWKDAVTKHNGIMNMLAAKEENKNHILGYVAKIKKYDATYQAPFINTSKSGCYIATAVYGSYDCPQVWTLRRYRDYFLAKSWYGRTFIRLYYAISPTLVKWFGTKKWFRKIWKGRLDCMVSRLNSKGVENTPYEDRKW